MADITRKSRKKMVEEYGKKGVIIDGDLLAPEHPRVQKAKAELRKAEQGYVNKTVNDFLADLEAKKEKITNDILDYAENEMKKEYDKEGNLTGKKLDIAAPRMNEYVINRLFFNSLTPLSSKEPKYNAEKLSLVFDLYEYVVATINAHICQLLPSKTHFCRFAGITTSTYNGYKLSEDPDMQVVIGKIEDMLTDVHLTMAEETKLNPMATKYRMNIEMDKRENFNPQVVIKADVKDLEDYKNRISSLEGIDYEVEDE